MYRQVPNISTRAKRGRNGIANICQSCLASYIQHVYLGRSQHDTTCRATRSSTHTHSHASFAPAVLLPHPQLWCEPRGCSPLQSCRISAHSALWQAAASAGTCGPRATVAIPCLLLDRSPCCYIPSGPPPSTTSSASAAGNATLGALGRSMDGLVSRSRTHWTSSWKQLLQIPRHRPRRLLLQLILMLFLLLLPFFVVLPTLPLRNLLLPPLIHHELCPSVLLEQPCLTSQTLLQLIGS